MRLLFLILAGGLLACLGACKSGAHRSFSKDPLGQILKTLAQDDTLAARVLRHPDAYELQIIYTQIDRNALGQPRFTSYGFMADSTRYFYPASMVKMPLSLLALEKINRLKRSGFPRMSRNTPYTLDSLRPFQQVYTADSTAPNGKPTLAHDIRQVFVVSDNLAYNHLFEFLGRQYINETLRAHGYTRTGIVHRFVYPGRDNRYSSPITFAGDRGTIYKEDERLDAGDWKNPQHSTLKGTGYHNANDSLVRQPYDMGAKNWFALSDMEKMIRAVMFPDAVPPANKFNLTADDYRFLWHYMGIFPRECDYPRYDTAHYYDGYVKFFLFGDEKSPRDGAPQVKTGAADPYRSARLFNKVGVAYGTVTDAACVVDFEHGIEFILAATLLCNRDGIFNDGKYEYDELGYPFLAKLGRAVHAYELKRVRPFKPDLAGFKKAVEKGF